VKDKRPKSSAIALSAVNGQQRWGKEYTMDTHLTFKNVPFSRLIKEAEELTQLRHDYALKSEEKRRAAADFKYHSSIASRMFAATVGQPSPQDSRWPIEVVALAIDPQYAPALVTVGSYEYLYGRIDEAMTLFLKLITLPEETEDIADIIDKAGDFLIDNQDYEHAMVLYSTAVREHPHIATYHNGLSYCYGKQGQFEEAIEHARCTVELEPDNHAYRADFGWTLIEAKQYKEAQTVLEQAVAMSPPDYTLARGNLEELRRRIKESLCGK